MSLLEARIHEIPKSIDRIHSDALYERMWQRQLPGFIIPEGVIKAPPRLAHIKLVERSAAWLSLHLPGQSVEAQQQDVWPDDDAVLEDIGPHVDGLLMEPGNIMWRTSTYKRGRATVFLATMNPAFLRGLEERGLNAFQMEAPIEEALRATQTRLSVDSMIDDGICLPDVYYGHLAPGDSITFWATDGTSHGSAVHDFVTVGSEPREFYEASARVFMNRAATIEPHELLETTQPAVQAWPTGTVQSQS